MADERLKTAGPLVAGANRTDHHLVGFDVMRDAQVALAFDDITTIRAGDAWTHELDIRPYGEAW